MLIIATVQVSLVEHGILVTGVQDVLSVGASLDVRPRKRRKRAHDRITINSGEQLNST